MSLLPVHVQIVFNLRHSVPEANTWNTQPQHLPPTAPRHHSFFYATAHPHHSPSLLLHIPTTAPPGHGQLITVERVWCILLTFHQCMWSLLNPPPTHLSRNIMINYFTENNFIFKEHSLVYKLWYQLTAVSIMGGVINCWSSDKQIKCDTEKRQESVGVQVWTYTFHSVGQHVHITWDSWLLYSHKTLYNI